MKSWQALKKGDLVDLIAPGYSTEMSKVEAGVRLLESWGLRVRYPERMIEPFYFHAQTDEMRLKFAAKALTAKDSAAVWCVRGGYGSARLLPGLAKIKKPARAKILIGISDITALHVFLNQSWQWPTFHGPLLERLGSGTLAPELTEECRALVFGEQKQIKFKNLKPLNAAARKAKRVSGSVVGGNLTVLQSLIGTKAEPRLAGKILFLEDIGERGYRVDRMLEQFQQAGLLAKCRGVVLGTFTGGDEPHLPGESFVPFALERFAESTKIPVWAGVESGHGDHQRVVPFGTSALIARNCLQMASGKAP